MSQKQFTDPSKEQAQLAAQLQQRPENQVATLFGPASAAGKPVIPLILSACDEGVARNGGRRGARFAPECLLHHFQKLALPTQAVPWRLTTVTCPPYRREAMGEQSFEAWQQQQAQLLAPQLVHPKLIHLGGGHDWVLPFLLALEEAHQCPITVINIDAHLDTRTDALAHSGTPFRQFSLLSKHPVELIQIGIHPWANAASNYQALEKGARMQLKSVNELLGWTPATQRLVVLSLDADGLDGSAMSAVSAVNGDGLSKAQMQQILTWYLELKNSTKCLGIYEYNPIFDDLSSQGARYLSTLMYRFLF